MIIELGNIHVKGKLLIEGTCMLPVNRNVAMWDRILFYVHSPVTNKGENIQYGGDRHCEANVTGDGDHKCNN
jgi:hypothetical protein